MYKRVSHARAVLMGLLFAMVGFTYSLASSRSVDAAAGSAGSRGVGTAPLRFLNNISGGCRDLGDVTLGSFVTRYARASGGIGALTYTSTRTPTLKEKLTGSTSTLDLLANGVLGGAGTQSGGLIAGLQASAFPLKFNIDVADQRGSNPFTAFDLFCLSLESSDTFKFAIDNLGEAVQFESIMDVVSTVNGNGAITVTAANVKLDGVAVTGGLEALGLSLAADGTLTGQPLKSGVLTFDATAKDAKGASALNRAKSAVGQTITLSINANSTIETDAVCLGLTLKVANPKGTGATTGNKDSATYKGQVNLANRKISDLNGDPIKLILGGYTSPNTTNTPATLQGGKTVKAPKVTGTKPAKLTASVKQSGQVQIKISGEDMSRISTFTGASTNLAVGVMIGDSIAAGQILTVSTKKGNSGVSAKYKFAASNTPAGTFILTKVQGKDDTKSTTEFDAWNAQFIATPQTGASFSGASSARVSIGASYVDTITVTEKNGKLSGKGDQKSAKVSQLKMDGAKGKGAIKTGFLPSAGATGTGIRAASKAATSAFPLNIVVLKGATAVYEGENSLNIASNGKNQWKNLTK